MLSRDFESIRLRRQGYNPTNTFACRDYNAGKITLSELWYVLDNNIVGVKGELFAPKPHKPSRGDAVTLDDKIHGKIVKVRYEDRRPSSVRVAYDNGDAEEYEYDDIRGGYSSKGGPTRWWLYTG